MPVVSLVQEVGEIPDNEDDSTVSREDEIILDADRLKYDRALAVQRLLRDPDAVYGSLKYHLAWNVAMRQPVFEHADDMFDEINAGLSVCSKFAGGFVGLLWLAPDHIHIYVESDGEKSVDAIAKHIKRTSTEIPHRMTAEVEGKSGIWDKAYFAETLG